MPLTADEVDASTIDLCLSVFPWALFPSTKSAVKLHTSLDLRGSIPTSIHVSDGKIHDVNAFDIPVPEPGAFYMMDRGDVDCVRLFLLHCVGGRFAPHPALDTNAVTPIRSPRPRGRCDQTVVLTGAKGKTHYPRPVRRIKYYDENTQKTFNCV